jgi:hypothetical protein
MEEVIAKKYNFKEDEKKEKDLISQEDDND